MGAQDSIFSRMFKRQAKIIKEEKHKQLQDEIKSVQNNFVLSPKEKRMINGMDKKLQENITEKKLHEVEKRFNKFKRSL